MFPLQFFSTSHLFIFQYLGYTFCILNNRYILYPPLIEHETHLEENPKGWLDEMVVDYSFIQ